MSGAMGRTAVCSPLRMNVRYNSKALEADPMVKVGFVRVADICGHQTDSGHRLSIVCECTAYSGFHIKTPPDVSIRGCWCSLRLGAARQAYSSQFHQ